MYKLLLLFSILRSISGQSFMDMPEYGFPPGVPLEANPMNPPISPPINQHFNYRNKANSQFRRDSNEQQQAMLKKFYDLDLLRNYSLNYTDWSNIWFEFEEMSVKNQTAQIKELRAKQKNIEMILIQLCEDRCLRDFCEMPINQQTTTILPRNSDSWSRFSDMKWEDIPLKIKKLIILQLKMDRFRAQNSLSMMVNELCPYNKYFDEVTNSRQTGSLNGESNPKIQAHDNPTTKLTFLESSMWTSRF